MRAVAECAGSGRSARRRRRTAGAARPAGTAYAGAAAASAAAAAAEDDTDSVSGTAGRLPPAPRRVPAGAGRRYRRASSMDGGGLGRRRLTPCPPSPDSRSPSPEPEPEPAVGGRPAAGRAAVPTAEDRRRRRGEARRGDLQRHRGRRLQRQQDRARRAGRQGRPAVLRGRLPERRRPPAARPATGRGGRPAARRGRPVGAGAVPPAGLAAAVTRPAVRHSGLYLRRPGGGRRLRLVARGAGRPPRQPRSAGPHAGRRLPAVAAAATRLRLWRSPAGC